jgi:phosphotransferase system  glucose/maltose/N-acetylglucosamine-specific IIC component
MTIGVAVLLVAVGAVLKWAVTAHANGFDIQTAGTIIFIVGLVGLVLALLYNFWWADRASRPVYRNVPPEPPARPMP